MENGELIGATIMDDQVNKMVMDQKLRLRCASVKALAEALGRVFNCLGLKLLDQQMCLQTDKKK